MSPAKYVSYRNQVNVWTELANEVILHVCSGGRGDIFVSHLSDVADFPPLGHVETDTTLFVIWVTNDRPESLSAAGQRVWTRKRALLKEP